MWYKTETILVSLVALLLSYSIGAVELQSKSNLNVLAVKASQKLLMDIKLLANDRLVAVGERGHIILSDNNGDSWRQVLVPTEELLTKLYFTDKNTGWAIGHQQVILKTEDAGESWELQNVSDDLDQPALFDVWFSNSHEGIAVGAYGLFLTTSDGGNSWQSVYQDSLEDEEIGFPHFYSLAFEEKSGKLFMAGELGFLAISEDLGATWQKLKSPYHGSFFHISVMPNGNLVLMGLRGHLFRSKDLAQTWQKISTGTISGLQNLLLLPGRNKLLIIGSDGTQLISSDYAKTVKLIQRNDRVHLAAGVALPNQQVLLVGIQGVVKADLN